MKLSKKERDLLAAAGITLKDEDFVEAQTVDTEEHTKEMARHTAESLLIMCNWPYPDVVGKDCLCCGLRFLTNLPNNVYCSQQCLKTELEKMGLVWNPDKPYMEQWGNLEPPLHVPPAAIKAMRRLLSIVDQGTPVVSHSPEPDYEPEPDIPEISEDVLPAPPIPYNDPDTQEEHDSESDDSFLALLDAQDD